MSKERLSATVDEDVAEYLDQPGRNRSETINMAVKAYMNSAGGEVAIIKMRLSQLQREKRQAASTVEDINEEIEKFEQRLHELGQEEKNNHQETWEEALQIMEFGKFKSTGDVYIRSDESMVEDFADRLDMDVESFRSELIDKHKNQ